jgi:septal ring-binding cell division protein DamX
MAIQSQDQLIAALSAGQSAQANWNKITGAAAYTAGRCYDFSMLAGSPVANTYPGTALAFVNCNEASGNGTQAFSLPHGGNVSALVKQMMSLSAVTASATGVPGTFMLVDLQGYYPGINMNSATSQTLTGTPTLRYTNGAGVRPYLVVTATTGATAHNLSYSYTNTAGTTGRTQPVTVACTASAIVPHITHSGTAANNYGPFLPLASGDTGVRSFQSVQLSAASLAGTAALCLARQLATVTVGVAGLQTEKDLLNQIPSFPVVPDGACLTWLYFAGAATAASSTFIGTTETVWG